MSEETVRYVGRPRRCRQAAAAAAAAQHVVQLPNNTSDFISHLFEHTFLSMKGIDYVLL